MENQIDWLMAIANSRAPLFDRVMATQIAQSLAPSPAVSERDICLKLKEWIKEGEQRYTARNPPVNPGSPPGVVKNYVQCLGWVMQDLRACLRQTRQELKEIRTIQ